MQNGVKYNRAPPGQILPVLPVLTLAFHPQQACYRTEGSRNQHVFVASPLASSWIGPSKGRSWLWRYKKNHVRTAPYTEHASTQTSRLSIACENVWSDLLRFMPLFHWPAMPRRSYGVRKMNRYTARSPRWFGGTSAALLFPMCCVSTVHRMAHGWRPCGAYGALMIYVWYTYDVAYENLTIAYSRRKWRMHSVHPTYARRSTRFYGVWRAYGQRMGCVHTEPRYTLHYVCDLWMWHLNVHAVENICI